MYRVTRKSVNWLAKCTLKYAILSHASLLLAEFTKLVALFSAQNSRCFLAVVHIFWSVWIRTFPLPQEDALGEAPFGFGPYYTTSEECIAQLMHIAASRNVRGLISDEVIRFLCHGAYEECRLLRYKNPVRTSQETHYVSVTESNRLMLCKIWGFHGSDYEECRFVGCYDPWFLQEPTFRRIV
jgi:hypothetical protein